MKTKKKFQCKNLHVNTTKYLRQPFGYLVTWLDLKILKILFFFLFYVTKSWSWYKYPKPLFATFTPNFADKYLIDYLTNYCRSCSHYAIFGSKCISALFLSSSSSSWNSSRNKFHEYSNFINSECNKNEEIKWKIPHQSRNKFPSPFSIRIHLVCPLQTRVSHQSCRRPSHPVRHRLDYRWLLSHPGPKDLASLNHHLRSPRPTFPGTHILFIKLLKFTQRWIWSKMLYLMNLLKIYHIWLQIFYYLIFLTVSQMDNF